MIFGVIHFNNIFFIRFIFTAILFSVKPVISAISLYGNSSKYKTTMVLSISFSNAMKNLNLFNSDMFKDEIENTFQMDELLRNVPIFLISNYDVSLLGACFAANHKKKN